MKIVFTKGTSILSHIICKVTGESVSHCALLVDNVIIHSNLLGITMVPKEKFKAKIIESIEVATEYPKLLNLFARYQNTLYDFGALLYLGLRYLLPFIPKANLWQSSGMFLCTEWVTTVLEGHADSLITPYKLYLKLVKEYSQ